MTALQELNKTIKKLEVQLEVERTKNRRKTERLVERHVAGEDAMTEYLEEIKNRTELRLRNTMCRLVSYGIFINIGNDIIIGSPIKDFH